jgi:hypothetical protein
MNLLELIRTCDLHKYLLIKQTDFPILIHSRLQIMQYDGEGARHLATIAQAKCKPEPQLAAWLQKSHPAALTADAGRHIFLY